MKGSIQFQKDRQRWCVSWYYAGRHWTLTRYKGMLMPKIHPDKKKDEGHKMAEKLLAMIQGDYENYLSGYGSFRMEKYAQGGWTDVIEYFQEWLETKKRKKPATYKGYNSYFKCWIKPFFEKNPVMLHEIKLDTLDKMLDFIELSGKGKHNVMMCFHTFMDYAWRSERIPEMPPFPKREDYNIVEPTIKWISEERQMKIINAIPEIHRPIFLWLKYHLRRPSEACAIKWEDYDSINSTFIIRRSISARQLVESTKTAVEHIIPCHSAFETHMKHLRTSLGEFIFTNPRARRPGKRYANESLNNIWNMACGKGGENIDLYPGLKHSSCSQYVNEKGLSISELQIITDHARLDSVRKYAKVEVSRKRALMERERVVDMNSFTKRKQTGE